MPKAKDNNPNLPQSPKIPTRRNGRPMTVTEKEALFSQFQETPHNATVARLCKVAVGTVAKYRIRDDWDGRLAKLKQKAEQKADDTAASRRARHVQLGKLLQGKGESYFKGKQVRSDATAVRSIESGVKIEREAVGDGSVIDVRVSRKLEDMSEVELLQRLKELKTNEQSRIDSTDQQITGIVADTEGTGSTSDGESAT